MVRDLEFEVCWVRSYSTIGLLTLQTSATGPGSLSNAPVSTTLQLIGLAMRHSALPPILVKDGENCEFHDWYLPSGNCSHNKELDSSFCTAFVSLKCLRNTCLAERIEFLFYH